jgi:hypothetical protein
MKGMRKTYACLLVFIIGSIGMFVGLISGDLWVKFSLGVLGLYIGGNVATKFSPAQPFVKSSEK